MLRRTIMLVGTGMVLATSVHAQQREHRLSRLDMLRTNGQGTHILGTMVAGGSIYSASTLAASALLSTDDQRLANEIALVANVGVCAGLEAKAYVNATPVGASVAAKRTDGIWDFVECSLAGAIHYLGSQVGWKEAGIIGAALTFLDWHFLPERDLRR